MRIAHISDLHLARRPALGELNAKRLLGYANYRLLRSRRHSQAAAAAAVARLLARRPDIVLLTGDATQHGLDSEFDATELLLSPFAAAGIPVLAVPGNHDVYGGGPPPRFAAFIKDAALGLAPDAAGIHRFPGVELLLLGQAVPTPPFLSYGRQNGAELARAGAVWSEPPPSGVTRLAAGHFPAVDEMGRVRGWLRGAARLVRFCAGCAVAGYFCGHRHRRYVAALPGGGRQYAAPSVSTPAGAEASIYVCAGGGVTEEEAADYS